MENEFLHRINVEALKKELKMDVPSIAKLAGISENGVYKWAWAKESHGARPPFNAIIKLLQAGAFPPCPQKRKRTKKRKVVYYYFNLHL